MRLSLTDVLSGTASVIARGLPTFFIVAIVCTAPAIALEVWLVEWRFETLQPTRYDPAMYASYPEDLGVPDDDELLRVSILALLASSLAAAFSIAATQAGVLYTVVENLAGRTPSIGTAIGKATLRLPAAIGAMVLVSCAVLFSSSCLAVPAVIVAALFYFAVPAAVIEELSPFKAVARSVDLTRGNRVLILGLVSGIVLLFAALHAGLRVLFDAPSVFMLDTYDIPASLPGWGFHLASGLTTVVEAIVLAVLSSVMYARLRERDGIDVEKLAEVFA